MNKKKLILKVEKIGRNVKKVTDKKGTISLQQPIQQGEVVPKVSYWEAFLVLSQQPRLTFYRQLFDQDF